MRVRITPVERRYNRGNQTQPGGHEDNTQRSPRGNEIPVTQFEKQLELRAQLTRLSMELSLPPGTDINTVFQKAIYKINEDTAMDVINEIVAGRIGEVNDETLNVARVSLRGNENQFASELKNFINDELTIREERRPIIPDLNDLPG